LATDIGIQAEILYLSSMSNFIVSARKYRPTRFEDVVGQEHVTQTLKNALQNDHLAHAFLFCGPRGVGKTTCARILAKVLNCQNPTDNFEPCGECSSCKSFQENASFNITELDAASNNSVEHIRALIEQVRFQPQQGRYKVFIIDEVHMLSQQAFNAFLKTLEEPPPYAIFILATTEKHKIIPTILSRCQIFDFRRIQVQRMVQHLEDICQQENITADAEALHIIAQKADGALRDALSIFDRIVSFSGDKIQYEDVIANLNVLDYDYYFKIVDALLQEDVSSVMLTFDTILRHGFEPDIFMTGLAEHIRNILVCKDSQTLQLLEVSGSLQERYQQQAQLTPSTFLLTALNIANDCDVNYKMARNKRLHVEMALIKMAYIQRAMQPGQPLAAEKKTPEPKLESTKPAEQQKVSEEVSNYTAKSELPKKPEPAPQPQAKEQTTTATKVQKKSTKLRKSSKFSTPSIKNLGTIAQEVRQNETTQEVQEAIQLELGKVQEVWNTYTEQVDQNSLEHVLKTTELSLAEDEAVIIAMVGSRLGENMLRQETKLIEALREAFNAPTLRIDIRIDESRLLKQQKPRVRKPSTPREKFDKMVAINPLVREMLDRFQLTPDEE